MATIEEVFYANYASRMDRQSDFALQDNRMITGALASAILQADDPQQFAGLSTSAVIPSTIPHPVQKPGT